MENEYLKRGYLLPEGCKDLIDVLRLNLPRTFVARELAVPATMKVVELANVIGQKPFRILVDLMELGIYAHVNAQIEFETVSRILKKYGIEGKRLA